MESACFSDLLSAASIIPSPVTESPSAIVSTSKPSGDFPSGIWKTRLPTPKISTTCTRTRPRYASIFPAIITQRGMGAAINRRSEPSRFSFSSSAAIIPTTKKANITVKEGTISANMLSGRVTRSPLSEVRVSTRIHGSADIFCTCAISAAMDWAATAPRSASLRAA